MITHNTHPKRVKKGFTTAELIIAMVILGVIAAFSIPHLLMNVNNLQNKAKAREVIKLLENAWDGVKLLDSSDTVIDNEFLDPSINPDLDPNDSIVRDENGRIVNIHQRKNLFYQIVTIDNPTYKLNVQTIHPLSLSDYWVDRKGHPIPDVVKFHPCNMPTQTNGRLRGIIELQGGAMVIGMNTEGEDMRPLDPHFEDGRLLNWTCNYLICIDANGLNGPNKPGQDIFIGNFNQGGTFSNVEQVGNINNQNFNWGRPNDASSVFMNGNKNVWINNPKGLLEDPKAPAANILN